LLRKNVDNYIYKNYTSFKKWNNRETITKKFTECFKEIQRKMGNEPENYEQSGSCAIACLTIDKNLYVINLGDSRCVLGYRIGEVIFAIQMSADHKPNDPDEEERIKKSKGEVTNHRDNNFGPYRVYKEGEPGPGLAVSRSLGDLAGHEVGCSEIPEISMKILENHDDFVVIGSDGVWDMMGSAEIAAFIYEKLDEVDRSKICDNVVDECRKRWGVINKYKDDLLKEKHGDVSSPSKSSSNVQNNSPSHHISNAPIHITIDDITSVIHFFK